MEQRSGRIFDGSGRYIGSGLEDIVLKNNYLKLSKKNKFPKPEI